MARIIVAADQGPRSEGRVLLEASVQAVHLSTDHAARQLIERLAWALGDAEELERSQAPYSAASALA